jgi:glucosamine 6-phosphate synthetase-like amidotransferase/phosphosugar isomerase protein
MPRGRTASGLAYVSVGSIKVIKKNVQAMKFINLPEYDKTEAECVNFDIANPPLSILGHCRLKTKGTELDNRNNHPIICNKIVGVHNGCISNDDDLFRIYAKMFGRNGEVDSEIIFALIDYFSRTCPIHEAIHKMSAIVQGSFACAMVHEMQPHVIWLFRRYNPCDVVLFNNVGLLSWSSERNYIKSAISGFIGEGEDIQLPQNSGMGIDLHRNRIHRFTIDAPQTLVM